MAFGEIGTQITGMVGGLLSGFGDIAITIFWIVLGGGIVLGAVYYFLEQKKYNKTVIVKRINERNQMKTLMDKAKYFQNKDGVDGWRLKGLRRKVEVPPDESLGITISGGTIASCVIDSNGQITWLEDTIGWDEYKKSKRYKPITSQSKANYAYHQSYNQRLRFDWAKQNASLIVGGITLVMLVAVVLFFLPKTFESYNEANSGIASAAESLEGAVEKLDEVWTNQQRIQEELEERQTQGVTVTEESGGGEA